MIGGLHGGRGCRLVGTRCGKLDLYVAPIANEVPCRVVCVRMRKHAVVRDGGLSRGASGEVGKGMSVRHSPWDVGHPPFVERRALAFCVFEMTRGRGFAPKERAANERMRRTVRKAWVSGIPGGP